MTEAKTGEMRLRQAKLADTSNTAKSQQAKISLVLSYVNLYKVLGGGWISVEEKKAAGK